ncbi:MAG: cbb3-type cytochrome c oxidase subunit I [Motiliproteus sp.]
MIKQSYNRQIRGWMVLAGFALFVANCLAVVLVLSRMPVVSEWFDSSRVFATSLVLHVDLSLYIWLMAVLAMLATQVKGEHQPKIDRLCRYLCFGGTFLMVLSPIAGGDAVLTNYFPVLRSPLFMVGAGIYLCGILLHLFWPSVSSLGSPLLRAGIRSSSICLLAAVVAVMLSFSQISVDLAAVNYYELLFWGGGHIVQQSYLLLMFCCWILIVESIFKLDQQPLLLWILRLAALPALAGAFVPLVYAPGSVEFRDFYTLLMRYASWLPAPLVVFCLLRAVGVRKLVSRFECIPLQAVSLSLAMLVIGLIVGALIRGDNLQVPAHYHAVTGAINLAIMGVGYLILPELGYRLISERLAALQIKLYAGGVFLLVVGLAWSGHLGVSRKVAGAEQGLSSINEHLAMSLMAAGGLIALLGSFLFLGILFQTMRLIKQSALSSEYQARRV